MKVPSTHGPHTRSVATAVVQGRVFAERLEASAGLQKLGEKTSEPKALNGVSASKPARNRPPGRVHDQVRLGQFALSQFRLSPG
ncbi:MAG: hypothetical protein WC205_09755 [Opitutaceae bacterium]